MATRAKFKVNHITVFEHSREVELVAVYPDKETPENKSYWENTPSGKLTMNITNPAAFSQFVPGKNYYLDISEAP